MRASIGSRGAGATISYAIWIGAEALAYTPCVANNWFWDGAGIGGKSLLVGIGGGFGNPLNSGGGGGAGPGIIAFLLPFPRADEPGMFYGTGFGA